MRVSWFLLGLAALAQLSHGLLPPLSSKSQSLSAFGTPSLAPTRRSRRGSSSSSFAAVPRGGGSGDACVVPPAPFSAVVSSSSSSSSSSFSSSCQALFGVPSFPLVASLSSLLHGYDTGVIAGALLFFPASLKITSRPDLVGLVITAVTLGAIGGSLVSSSVQSRVGRVGSLRVGGLLFLLASVLSGTSPTVYQLVLGRCVAGLGMGLTSATVPLYISECSPPERRGTYATIPQFCISLGILLSYVVDLTILSRRGGAWRAMLGMSCVPAVLQLCGSFFFLTESPRWLLSKGRPCKAKAALRSLREGVPQALVDEEFREMKAAADRSAAELRDRPASGGIASLVRSPASLRALLTCVTLQVFQQLCGINAIVYFTPTILREAGVPALLKKVGVSDPNAASMLSTIVAYAPKLPALLLAANLMDKLGRRTLLLTFVPVMGLSLATLASCFVLFPAGSPARGALAIASVMAYGVVFVMSLGPVPSILSSEIFPQQHRSVGMSASIASQWGANAAVSMLFPVLQYKLGTTAVLSFFAVMCVACEAFTYAYVPETKGVSLEKLGETTSSK